MILKALYDYYKRCGDLAPQGMEYKEIAFLVVIDGEGRFVQLEERDDGKGGQKFLVMKGVRSGTTPKPYLFWDNVEYVLNYTKEHALLEDNDDLSEKERAGLQAKVEKSAAKHKALRDKFESVARRFPEEQDLRAVCLFYEKGELPKVKCDPLWQKIKKKPIVNVSFLISGATKIVAENPCLRRLAETAEDEETVKGICLVTGEKGELAASNTPTPIAGGQAIGRLVAFQVNSGYDSYGKQKGYNAPISKEAEAAYTTALNKLKDKDSRNKFMLGSRTFVFWASSQGEAAVKTEKSLYSLFGYDASEDDDPNARIENVRKVFTAIQTGKLCTSLDDRFYILGLAPNAARIAVCYWSDTSLRDFAATLLRHFDDMAISATRKEKRPYVGVRAMLATVTQDGKLSEVTPNLPDAVVKSIFQGQPYPQTLFTACLRRIHAEVDPKVDPVCIGRAAIIKAYLNRLRNNNDKKIEIMLDKENANQGYLCGRLFAVLDKIQEDANNIHSIRERYMNAASTTPSAVFATILNLSTHHAEKLKGDGQRIFYEKLKQEIMCKLPADGFPAHLNLQDQGRFFVGYYHQRQDFFTSKTDNQKQTL